MEGKEEREIENSEKRRERDNLTNDVDEHHTRITEWSVEDMRGSDDTEEIERRGVEYRE